VAWARFEPSCVALLHARGVPLAAAVAATVLFRILALAAAEMVPALVVGAAGDACAFVSAQEQLREHDLGQRRHG
jgi:hypothetical protein